MSRELHQRAQNQSRRMILACMMRACEPNQVDQQHVEELALPHDKDGVHDIQHIPDEGRAFDEHHILHLHEGLPGQSTSEKALAIPQKLGHKPEGVTGSIGVVLNGRPSAGGGIDWPLFPDAVGRKTLLEVG
jgi:hypothetical protein